MTGADLRFVMPVGLVVVAALVSACAGSDDDSKGNGSGGAGGSGGGTGATSGSGGSGTPTIPTCAAKEARVTVAGGMSYTFSYVQATNINSANDNTTKWSWGQRIGDYGVLRLVGSGAVTAMPNQPADGATLTIDHGLFAPNVGDTLGTMYGVTTGSGSVLRRENGQVVVDLMNVATLEGCGDFPAMGEINLCYNTAEPGDDCPREFDRGTLDGYKWEDDVGGSQSQGPNDLWLSVGAQGGQLRGRLGADGATIDWAMISTSIYKRYEGKTLCAGPGSQMGSVTFEGKTYTVYFLKNLGWLEGPGTGQITGCLG